MKGADRMIVIPGKIRGKQRPRFNTKTGKVHTANTTLGYENWVVFCYKDQGGRKLEGAVKARIEVYHQLSNTTMKSKKLMKEYTEGKLWPIKKPDTDNIAKIILDGLNGIAYKDDAQVVELTVVKRYTEDEERVELSLEEVK